MSNILDYLAWRGDLTFARDEPNEIDMLILAQLAHAPFENLRGGGMGLTLPLLRPAVYPAPPGKDANELEQRRYELWLAAEGTPRFGDVKLTRFVSRFQPEREKQFAAAAFDLGAWDAAAFRGTDATLVGWKEDFNMAFASPVPSQTDAVAFLEACAREGRELYATGHSKGGNLAVYAASMCGEETRARIRRVYSFDGPGLDDETRGGEGYRAIYGRVSSFIPESSVIGLLMGYHDEYTVVDSDGVSLLQHDPYLWHVTGARFAEAEDLTRTSRFTDKTLHAFLSECPPEERRTLVDTLYGVLAATRAVRLRDLPRGLALHAADVLEAARDVTPAAREALKRVLGLLASAGGDNLHVLLGLGAKPDADEPPRGLPM